MTPDVGARLFAEGPVGVLRWHRDQGWRVVLATPNLERLLGYGPAEFLSGEVEYANIVHEQDNPTLFERVGLAATSGEGEVTLAYRVVTKSGATRRLYDRTMIERDDKGEPAAFTSYLLDVTGEDRGEASREFVAHMSHEIRTPLSGMLGLVEALSATRLDAEQADILAAIRDAGGSLLQLLTNVLDLSKIDAGRMTLDIGDFRLGEICVAAERLFARRAAANGVGLSAEGDAFDIPLRGDAGRLRQMLVNLVSNAVKFTREGRIRIRWRCAAPDAEGRVLARISVSDTGVGMSAETVDRLFEDYAQADARTATEFGGTGLGLAISRRLAALMGGRLWVDSAPGRGSTFHFEASFEASETTATEVETLRREEANAAARAVLAARRPRVLAAEDTVANQRVLELLLSPLGVEVAIARDGREAVELYRRGGWDAVLMDSKMPVLGGVEATAEIRAWERDEGLPRTPVLALTAETLDKTIDAFRRAGADDYLAKPFDPQRLYRTLAALLT
jgi:signal transduction histidine kinase/CheY-like chemotaxis protein